ncbi:flagellar hook-length control protein FliK [Bermanella sp. R86510]|uniref:flagellar hook-length control protein FliK n=1 Tax=unclassified Bermanella TaxID=2627862 RepID=UPI0037C537F6
MQGLPFFNIMAPQPSSSKSTSLDAANLTKTPLKSMPQQDMAATGDASQTAPVSPFFASLSAHMAQTNGQMLPLDGQTVATLPNGVSNPVLEGMNIDGQSAQPDTQLTLPLSEMDDLASTAEQPSLVDNEEQPTETLMSSVMMDMDTIQAQRSAQPIVNASQIDAQPITFTNAMAERQVAQGVNAFEQENGWSMLATQQNTSQSQNMVEPLPSKILDPQNQVQSQVHMQAQVAQNSPLSAGFSLKELNLTPQQPTTMPEMQTSAEMRSASTQLSGQISEMQTQQLAAANQLVTESTTDKLEGMDEGLLQNSTSNLAAKSTTPKQGQALGSNQFEQQLQNKLDVPPNDPKWSEQVAKRVTVMVNDQVQSARIQLDPPELGSLEVKVKVQQDQVSVSFNSNNQQVRDALEAQSPRLRELLNQQGVELGSMDVSSQNQQQQGDSQGQGLNQETMVEGDALASGDAADHIQQTIDAIEQDGAINYFA